MLLVSGVNIFYKQYEQNNVNDNIIIDTPDTSYINDEIALK